MTTFQGKPVFRPFGTPKDSTRDEWAKTANRAVKSGGRVYQSQTGDMHIVSPEGRHWGSLKSRPEVIQGGSLGKYEADEDTQDITDKFR